MKLKLHLFIGMSAVALQSCGGDSNPSYDQRQLAYTMTYEGESEGDHVWALRIAGTEGVLIALTMRDENLVHASVQEEGKEINRAIDVPVRDGKISGVGNVVPGRWMRVDYAAAGQFVIEYPAVGEVIDGLGEYDEENPRVYIDGEWRPVIRRYNTTYMNTDEGWKALYLDSDGGWVIVELTESQIPPEFRTDIESAED